MSKDFRCPVPVDPQDDLKVERAPSFLRTLPKDRYGEFRLAGEGGMGIVYWAIDTDLNREVAFKIIRPGTQSGTDGAPRRPTELTPPAEQSGDSRSFRALKQRFLQEAWITSSMAHPGIVPVYELGQTSEGVPYYTMRFIGGERTLASAIQDVAAKDVDERLALLEPYLKICDAVRYAHSRGVLHRDLKPSNVAIGEFGEVVVLDWGLSRYTGNSDPKQDDRLRLRLREYRAAHDRPSIAGALGTPGYMGPEAMRGEDDAMDERSDVYSLGAILFEILTGRLPFTFETFGDLATKLLAGPAPAARDVDPTVPARLSALVAACLERRSEDRPASVDAIAAEIRRWQIARERERLIEELIREAGRALGSARASQGGARIHELDHAVAAVGRLGKVQPDHPRLEELTSAIDLLRERGIREQDRATRRRLMKRVGVIGLTLATAATVLAAVLIDTQRRTAQEAHVRETEQRSRAEDLAAYMLGDLRKELEPLGRLDLLGKVARKSLEYYEKAPTESLTRNDRHSRGIALCNIGEVLQDSGNLVASEKLFQESMEILSELLVEEPENRELRRDLSVSGNCLGDVRQETGDLRGALQLYGDALEIRRGLFEDGEVEPLARDDIARTLDRIGDVLIRLGDRDPALDAYRESLAIRRVLVSERPEEAEWWDQLAASYVKVGDSSTKTGDLPAALESYEDARKILEQILTDSPTSSQRKDSLAGCLFRIAYVHQQRGESVAALERYRRSLSIFRSLAAVDPSHAWWQRNIALSLDRVAGLVQKEGNREAALGHYLEAQEIRKSVSERDPTNTRAAHDLVASHMSVGDFAKTGEDLDTARESFRVALEIARRLANVEPENAEWQTDVAHCLNRTASMAATDGDMDAAERDYRDAIGILRRLLEKDPGQTEMQQNLSLNLRSLGDLAKDRKDLSAARKIYGDALEVSRRLAAGDHTNRSWQIGLITLLNRTAEVATQMDDTAAALGCHEEAIVVQRRLLVARPGDGERMRDLSYHLYYSGVLREGLGQLPEALADLREGTSLHRRASKLLPKHAAEEYYWTTAYSRVVMAIGEEGLETSEDHLTLAYGLHAKKDYAGATEQFARALEDGAIRADLGRGNLYNAACSAALAGSRERAVAWLTEDLGLRRDALADAEAALDAERNAAKRAALTARAQSIRGHLEHARVKDPDLESIRSRPGFLALFE